MCFIIKTSNFFKARIKAKKIHTVLKLGQSQWLKPCDEFDPEKRIEVEKAGEKIKEHCAN